MSLPKRPCVVRAMGTNPILFLSIEPIIPSPDKVTPKECVFETYLFHHQVHHHVKAHFIFIGSSLQKQKVPLHIIMSGSGMKCFEEIERYTVCLSWELNEPSRRKTRT